MAEINVPPRWILFLLWPFKGEPCYPQIEGDLAEEFQQRIEEYGISHARQWYYKEICRNLFFLIFRWVTIPVILLPLLCLLIHVLLVNLYGWLWRTLPGTRSSIPLFIDFLFCILIGLIFAIFLSRLLSRHDRMIRLAFGFYYLAMVALVNLGTVINVWRGLRISIFHIPWIIFMGNSFWYAWPLVFFLVGSVLIERNHKFGRSS